jgi:SAM-dependent methyltransferase
MDSRQYYDLLADEYEEQDEFWTNPYDLAVWELEHQMISGHLDVTRPVIDVGCGLYPHDGFSRSARIVAGDISFGSLLVAKRVTSPNIIVDYIQYDTHALPFSDDSLHQVIVGGELLNHVDYGRVAAELARAVAPGGAVLVQFGVKWCLDSLWALLDSILGHRLGYSVTSKQAATFLRYPSADATVTWQVTPTGSFTVQLLTPRNVRRAFQAVGFRVRQVRSVNMLSGLIPLPWQQDPNRRWAQKIAALLLAFDKQLGRLYPLNLFSGNVCILMEKLEE